MWPRRDLQHANLDFSLLGISYSSLDYRHHLGSAAVLLPKDFPSLNNVFEQLTNEKGATKADATSAKSADGERRVSTCGRRILRPAQIH